MASCTLNVLAISRTALPSKSNCTVAERAIEKCALDRAWVLAAPGLVPSFPLTPPDFRQSRLRSISEIAKGFGRGNRRLNPPGDAAALALTFAQPVAPVKKVGPLVPIGGDFYRRRRRMDGRMNGVNPGGADVRAGRGAGRHSTAGARRPGPGGEIPAARPRGAATRRRCDRPTTRRAGADVARAVDAPGADVRVERLRAGRHSTAGARRPGPGGEIPARRREAAARRRW